MVRPDPYLRGAKLTGADPSRCLVVEDAPAGIQSGRAAGSKTLALLTSHTREQVEAANPDFIVKDLPRSVFWIVSCIRCSWLMVDISVTMKLAENGGVNVIIN